MGFSNKNLILINKKKFQFVLIKFRTSVQFKISVSSLRVTTDITDSCYFEPCVAINYFVIVPIFIYDYKLSIKYTCFYLPWVLCYLSRIL